MPRPTLDELLTTPTGQAMLAELDAEQVAAEEVADDERAENCSRWQTELDSLASDYESLRDQALVDLEALARTAMELVVLKAKCRELAAAIKKSGGIAADAPIPMFGEARRPLVKLVEIVRERLPRAV